MEEFALKFLLGSNLQEQLGETEVMREAEMSGEKCSVTAECAQPAGGSCAALWGRTPGRRCWVGRDSGGDKASAAVTPSGLLTSSPCRIGAEFELRRGLGPRRFNFKSYLCHLLQLCDLE